jgi:hypothetical protein
MLENFFPVYITELARFLPFQTLKQYSAITDYFVVVRRP